MTDRALRAPEDLDALDFAKLTGLVPVVAQDAADGRALMLAFATREALERSLATGEMHFWSRSRGVLWRKGETSGNTLRVVSLHADCDGDAVLALVRPTGPACHTGEGTCFGDGAAPEVPGAGDGVLATLDATLAERQAQRPSGSYTVRLLDDENLRLKKLGEETAELVAALAKGDPARAREEAADLLYHMLVALRAAGVAWGDVAAALHVRHGDRVGR
ncbi:MAG TPA: bifunctional phosphoribosyl-AMP cyclohydrolase/phosphoribosyl-ATP diphosphatase HisIE [Longimicrobiales bacterium]|nr:bifunctional phosphoribosyl-AMP cyclohydrolase/phosphoribosyl-ATP diphosphatase HisIE [Longimicrobiales bacterium]